MKIQHVRLAGQMRSEYSHLSVETPMESPVLREVVAAARVPPAVVAHVHHDSIICNLIYWFFPFSLVVKED